MSGRGPKLGAARASGPPASILPDVTVAPIVNGQAEAGWEGVGALTTKYGSHYGGAYCTGELIAPQWVLTAGHCTTGADLADQGDFVESGTCFGDSGGPDFVTLEDGTHVIAGVTSVGAGCPLYDPNCDPCQTQTYSTRIDVHRDWIEAVIGGGVPTCHSIPSMCRCTDACQPDGRCDDTVCHVDDCPSAYQCVGACEDEACRAAFIAAWPDKAQTDDRPVSEPPGESTRRLAQDLEVPKVDQLQVAHVLVPPGDRAKPIEPMEGAEP